jgi:hypothetical protein
MKMIYAGPSASPQATPDNYLFNCLRNVQCQPAFFVPLRSLSDIFLYFEFPFGKPASWLIQLVDCDGTVNQLSFCNYLIARKPDGTWFGIFTSVTDDVGDLYQFRIQATFFSASETGYKYFSEQLEISTCDPLVKIEACYPIPEDLTRAYDCNGIYYGPHTGSIAAQGNTSLRYLHFAYVRKGSVQELSNKMEITLFNSRRAYKNILTKTSVLESERMPKFYKDMVLGIFMRGNILVEGVEYPLAPSQEISANKEDKMWEVDILLEEICKQYFGCSDETCEISPAVCDNFPDVNITDAGFVFSGSTLAEGETITWTLYDSAGDVIETREVSNAAGNWTDIIDLEANCYTLKWIKNCLCDLNGFPSLQNTKTAGNCGTCGSVTIISAALTVDPDNTVNNLVYTQYPSGSSECYDMIEIQVSLIDAVSADTSFEVQMIISLYGVPTTFTYTVTILDGQNFGKIRFTNPYGCDGVVDSYCILSCSDTSIDFSDFHC